MRRSRNPLFDNNNNRRAGNSRRLSGGSASNEQLLDALLTLDTRRLPLRLRKLEYLIIVAIALVGISVYFLIFSFAPSSRAVTIDGLTRPDTRVYTRRSDGAVLVAEPAGVNPGVGAR